MQPPENPATPRVSQRPTVVLIGASVRASARSAKRGGYRVVGIDLFGDTDTRELCDEFHAWSGEDEKWITRIRRATQHFPVLQVGDILHAETLGCFHPRSETGTETKAGTTTDSSARQWRNFDDLEDLVGDGRIRFPETTTAEQPPKTGRWLSKRVDSCGGLGVRWAETQTTFGEDVPPDRIHHQRWVAGRTYGATIFHDGEQTRLLGVCRAVSHRGINNPFIYGGSIGPLRLPTSVEEAIARFSDSLVKHRELHGLFNIDFVLDSESRLWILEVNPRWSASMELIELAMTSIEPESSLIAACIDPRRAASIPDSRSSGQLFFKKIHFAKRRETFVRGDWESRLRSQETLHDIPADGEIIEPGHPICTTIERIRYL